ncbi:MAG: M18 family aminopeptidase, partial [Bacteroidales bacterium]|nr:M18 family aminopeptidase [Bacteroidales bacterium]
MINNLLKFLDASPVNYLAVATMEEMLSAAGFKKLDPAKPIAALQSGDQFYVTKNDSSLYAFRLGRKSLAESGFKIICAHCDSPTFRIKPNPEMLKEGNVLQLNTEVYGGAILSTWFDRPLSLAGRVI